MTDDDDDDDIGNVALRALMEARPNAPVDVLDTLAPWPDGPPGSGGVAAVVIAASEQQQAARMIVAATVRYTGAPCRP